MNRQGALGFTLIELMIVVVIVAILAAVAYPSYTRYVQDSRRSVMQGDMMDFAATVEAYRAQRFSYNGADTALTVPSNDFFTLKLDVATDNQSYEMTATPKGSMDGTGVMKLDSQGNTCFVRGKTDCTLGDKSQTW